MYTKNYNLYVTESTDDPKFYDWRNEMSGSENSNMQKIDEALASQKSTFVNLVLTADGWDDNKMQILNVAGLQENQNGSISVASSANAEQREAARNAVMAITGQANGSLTVTADGELPGVDIPVTVILLG